MTSGKLVGASLVRREDHAFLTGQGCYTDDLSPPGVLYGVFVRSPHPHAGIDAMDTRVALESPGVRLVLTHADLAEHGVGPIPTLRHDPAFAIPDVRPDFAGDAPQYPLARDRVRYLGEPVAFVVADTLAAARAGAEAVMVEYTPLATVIDYQSLLDGTNAALFEAVPDNCTLHWRGGDAGATDAAFDAAAHVARVRVVNNRVAIAFMEPRAALAEYDTAADRWRLSAGNQGAHGLRATLATMLGVDIARLQVVTPDTGGGFGARGVPYPEYTPVLLAAKTLGAPVKWTAERSEAFLADTQARDHLLEGELAVDADGRFTALRAQIHWRHGGYLGPRNAAVMVSYLIPTLGGVYGIRHLDAQMRLWLSNTTPHAAYRGIGRVEATVLIESLVEAAARETGIDPVTLRRRNLVPVDAFPWTAVGGAVYSGGLFEHNLDRALALADHEGFEVRLKASREHGLMRGFGVGMFVENDGGAPSEYARLEVRSNGQVVLHAGTQDFGMGHTTVYSQVVADALGVPFESVQVIEGDTDVVAAGSGSHGSRSARVGGGAVVGGAMALIEKGREIAAEQFEAGVDDVEFDAGQFRVAGTDRTLTLLEVAAQAEGAGDRLDGEHTFMTTGQAHSNGAQVCEVEVDPDTGTVRIDRHIIVADVGRVLNPLITVGQMHGGLAQGIGQAWMEAVRYDPESGQTLTGSFMDYAIPRADEMPSFVTEFTELAEPDNPLGVKGAGEGPTSGSPAAFMNAVRHALGPQAGQLDMPATPEAVWRACRATRSRASVSAVPVAPHSGD